MNKETTIAIPADPNDPEDRDVTVAALERALADRRTRLGRPRGATKEPVTIRLDRDVVAKFRAGGPGWQSRLNATLRKAVGL